MASEGTAAWSHEGTLPSVSECHSTCLSHIEQLLQQILTELRENSNNNARLNKQVRLTCFINRLALGVDHESSGGHGENRKQKNNRSNYNSEGVWEKK